MKTKKPPNKSNATVRVLMLAEAPEVIASSRVVCFEIAKYLQRDGFHVDVMPPVSSHFYLFCTRPNAKNTMQRIQAALLWRFYRFIIIPCSRIRQIMRAHSYDIAIVQRTLWYIGGPVIFERLLRKRIKYIIYNYDDALYLHEPEKINERIRLADAVWTGNPILAQYARHLNNNVFILEAGIDLERYSIVKDSYVLKSPIIIGWAGNPHNLRHLSIIEDALAELSKKFNICFRLICSHPYQFKNSEIRSDFIEWKIESEVTQLSNLDIGVMPLISDEYSHGKEGYKIKQYMACGIPVVASAVGFNKKLIEDGINGFLANSTEEWIRKLAMIIEDSELRSKLGKAGRQVIEKNYNMKIIANKLRCEIEKIIHKGSQIQNPI